MRKYSSITPKFWIGKTGRKLRGDISAKLVAAYLLSCPNNDMTGVFYCPLCQISAETGLPLEAPSKALRSQEQEQEQEQETYTRTEKSEKQSAVAENFAGREREKPVSLKTEAIEEELPLEEQEASVSKKEIVEPKPKKEVKTQRLQKPEELTDEFWQDFLAYRKQKKAPVTERVVSLLRKEAKTAGWKLEEVINEMMVRNWTGFKADWVKDDWKDPNAHWVSASEYNKELPPVTYSTGARSKFVEKLHAGMSAYDIKDLSNNKEQR